MDPCSDRRQECVYPPEFSIEVNILQSALHGHPSHCTAQNLTELHCTEPYSTLLRWNELYSTTLYCTEQYYTILYCTEQDFSALRWSTLHCTVQCHTTLHCTEHYYSALQCSASVSLFSPAQFRTKTFLALKGRIRPGLGQDCIVQCCGEGSVEAASRPLANGRPGPADQSGARTAQISLQQHSTPWSCPALCKGISKCSAHLFC